MYAIIFKFNKQIYTQHSYKLNRNCTLDKYMKWQWTSCVGSRNGIISFALIQVEIIETKETTRHKPHLFQTPREATPAAGLIAQVTCVSLSLWSAKCHLPWTPTAAKNPPNGTVSLAGLRKQPSLSYRAEINTPLTGKIQNHLTI